MLSPPKLHRAHSGRFGRGGNVQQGMGPAADLQNGPQNGRKFRYAAAQPGSRAESPCRKSAARMENSIIAPHTDSSAGPVWRRLSGSTSSRETGSAGRKARSSGRAASAVFRRERWFSPRVSPATASAPSQWAVSISQPPAGFGRRPPSEPTKGLMTPVAAAMVSSSRPASPPRSQSPSSRWADAGDPDSQQKPTVIQRFSRPLSRADRPFKTIMGNSAGMTLRTNTPAAPLTAFSTSVRIQQHQRRQPKKPRHETSSFAKRTAASSLPAAFFSEIAGSRSVSAEDRLFFRPQNSLCTLIFRHFRPARRNFVSKSSQFMQQNVTLVRHTICEVIAWQRF